MPATARRARVRFDAIVHALERNRGKGHAVRAGMARAVGALRLMTDWSRLVRPSLVGLEPRQRDAEESPGRLPGAHEEIGEIEPDRARAHDRNTGRRRWIRHSWRRMSRSCAMNGKRSTSSTRAVGCPFR